MENINISVSNNLIKLAKSIKKNGGNVYIVGGYVRNSLLGLDGTDCDICGDLTYDKIITIATDLGFDAHVVNKRLGTVLVQIGDEEYEYTTFRKENYSKGGTHSPDDVAFVNDIALDASRRDFTANSLYYNINTGKIEDFYTGIDDIKNRTLRCIKTPKEVFSSDGLRILRMIRIANELGFKIEKNTRLCAREYAHQLRDISGERVLKELKKIVVSDFKYSTTYSEENFLDNFNYIKIYKYIFNDNFSKFKIGKKYRKNFFGLPKHFRIIGFWIILLAEYFGYTHVSPNQINYVCMTYLGNSGLKESNTNIQTIISTYSLFQDIMYGDANYRRAVMTFYNCDSEVKKFFEAFVPKQYNQLRFAISIMRKRNIPLCYEELKINNMELIEMARVDKYNTSKIRAKLLLDCLHEHISNTFDTLLAEAKYINIKLNNKEKADR